MIELRTNPAHWKRHSWRVCVPGKWRLLTHRTLGDDFIHKINHEIIKKEYTRNSITFLSKQNTCIWVHVISNTSLRCMSVTYLLLFDCQTNFYVIGLDTILHPLFWAVIFNIIAPWYEICQRTEVNSSIIYDW